MENRNERICNLYKRHELIFNMFLSILCLIYVNNGLPVQVVKGYKNIKYVIYV